MQSYNLKDYYHENEQIVPEKLLAGAGWEGGGPS